MNVEVKFTIRYRKPLERAYDFLRLIFCNGFSIRAARVASRAEKIPTIHIDPSVIRALEYGAKVIREAEQEIKDNEHPL